MKLRKFLLIGLIGAIFAMPSVVFGEEAKTESRLAIDNLELEHTKSITLTENQAILVNRDGVLTEIPVTLQLEAFKGTLSKVGAAADGFKRHGSIYCLTLRAKEARNPYQWSMWTLLAFGNVALLNDGKGKNYLAWVQFSSVLFAEITNPADSSGRLEEFLASGGKMPPDIVYIPVGNIVPDANKWGVNALYFDIKTKLIEKAPDGTWRVQISNPKGDLIYDIVSDQTATLGWRLLR